ncbi:MAG: hypothetical protein LBG18_04725 [Mediterranea sp.]|nr:hypothetical protein [Mediterranea sp.]
MTVKTGYLASLWVFTTSIPFVPEGAGLTAKNDTLLPEAADGQYFVGVYPQKRRYAQRTAIDMSAMQAAF